jgi:hypothetical protein
MAAGVGRLFRGVRSAAYHAPNGAAAMLETVTIVLVLLWLLGWMSAYTMGGFIHVLLVIAVVVVLVRIIQGRRL